LKSSIKFEYFFLEVYSVSNPNFKNIFLRTIPKTLSLGSRIKKLFFFVNVNIFEQLMHASLNASPQAPLESAYNSSSMFSMDVQSLNLGILRQTLILNKSPSEFCSPKPGTTPNAHEQTIQIKMSPENNTTTTNESYSIDNCFQENNSGKIKRR